MKDMIREIILSEGADVCGIANISEFDKLQKGFRPQDVWEDCKSVISIGIALPKGISYANSKLIYGYFNADTCNVLDRIALRSAKRIEEDLGAIAVPIPSDGPYDYWEKDTLTGKGILSMKHVAVACGVGQMGKNSLLLNLKYGNMLIVGAILTDLKLDSDNKCENICINGCKKCIEACPVQAIQGNTVNQKLCRNNAYGKNSRGFDTVECNKCRMICPMRFGKVNK